VKILNKIWKTGPIIIQNATIIKSWKAANLTADVRREPQTCGGHMPDCLQEAVEQLVSFCFGFCGYYWRDPFCWLMAGRRRHVVVGGEG
jgi:hypothetical protein